MSGSIAAQHLRELAARKSKVYELLLALEENSSADEACFRNLAGVIDRVLFNEVSPDSEALSSLASFLKTPSADLGSALAALGGAAAQAEPERDGLRLLVSQFANWNAALSASARPYFLTTLPNIGALLKELGSSGVEDLIRCYNQCGSDSDCELISRSIARYQETMGEIVVAAAELASLFIRTDARPRIEKLLNAVPPEAMYDSKDARTLLPAIAGLKTAASGDAVWSAAAGVAVAAACHNHSSARNLARQIGSALASVPAESRIAYLTAFESILDEAGIALAGYGCKQLPAIFQNAGVARASRFVAEGVAVARKYGKIAAQEFFEQKTAASKQALASGT